MPPPELKNIIKLTEKQINLAKDEILCREGEIDQNIYYVNSGSIKIFITTDDDEHIIRFAYKNNLFVMLDSFLSQKPGLLYAQAIKKTKLSVIPKSKFDQFINSDQRNVDLWINILKSLILQQQEREIDLLIHSPQERINRVLHRSPELFQEIPRKYIANYLRMSPETLSRIVSR